MNCPHCQHELSESELRKLWAEYCGRQTSTEKAKTSAANGRKGGRPVSYFQNLYDAIPECINQLRPELERRNYRHIYDVDRMPADDPTENGFYLRCTPDTVWHCRWNRLTGNVEAFQNNQPVAGYNTVNNSAKTAAKRLVEDIHRQKLMSMPEDNSDIEEWIKWHKRR